jgi:hypothetical protein
MDVAYISALSALAGSIVGGLTSGTTTWITQRAQVRALRMTNDRSRLQSLFRDFIVAASEAYGDATQSSEPKIRQLVDLYSMISRMRALCANQTVARANEVMDIISSTYALPNKSLDDLNANIRSGKGLDPLGEFAEAAREELEGDIFS